MGIFESQDPVDLFFYQFEQGYWEHMHENITLVVSWLGG